MLTPDFIEVKKNQSLAERNGYTYDQVMGFLNGGVASAPTKKTKAPIKQEPVENIAETTDNLDDLFGSDIIEGVE